MHLIQELEKQVEDQMVLKFLLILHLLVVRHVGLPAFA